MNLVWFKRDLRVVDHKALSQALSQKPIILLYIFEPELWLEPDLSFRHYKFLLESLVELKQEISRLGGHLNIKVGKATEILEEIFTKYQVTDLYSHQETWNYWTYNRDRAVNKLCKRLKVSWHEPRSNGVFRRLKDRDGWSRKWGLDMQQEVLPKPTTINSIDIGSTKIPSCQTLKLNSEEHNQFQVGGRSHALQLLNSFLYQRGENYTVEMSSPVTAYDSCSRLSAYLAFGCISIRELFQHAKYKTTELANIPPKGRGKWPSAMRSFAGRLRWHCHFIQKLEDQPNIEFFNMHQAYNNLRQDTFNEQFFTAWCEGKTGYPMVDACMRALKTTGWLNFRMRAMVMSFASYHLWLHWRRTSLYLATQFVDYEPGIHYSQAQMQSGTTGINSIRIYNPIKQGIDQDPNGEFIRKWVPELSEVPNNLIHKPWEGCVPGYPKPIVDEATARKYAADQLYGLRKTMAHKINTKAIVKKHASRRTRKTTKEKNDDNK